MSKVLANLAGKDCQVLASLAGNDFVKIYLHYLPFAKKGNSPYLTYHWHSNLIFLDMHVNLHDAIM